MRKIILLPLLLAACSTQSQDAIARGAARSTVTKIVVDRFPGAPVEPVLDCVIDNASATQIYALAADTIGGPTESSIQIVADVVQKPETITCLSTTGLAAVLSGAGA
ncbi:hypothetical protein [Salipiger bermudensis]|uniref:hypothetical protein n=1 Tax=Salipiger bermudensis TaxID=344736 RepID=UPI001CD19A4A|nr:hypothetical protein [Salipiger bermudensis]MCA1287316.1 hypothetical protein [Salipiger bermudensis]